jgi:CheY-like chemotaxis protein
LLRCSRIDDNIRLEYNGPLRGAIVRMPGVDGPATIGTCDGPFEGRRSVMSSEGPRVRVLVVDDEEGIRQLVMSVLHDAAIEAVDADSGKAALQRLKSGGRFDLLLTDVRMPEMDGFELARRARAAQPELRVLFMTGYMAEYQLHPSRESIIAKPFRPAELLGCIFEILKRPDGGRSWNA